jgi:hypothetical protein
MMPSPNSSLMSALSASPPWLMASYRRYTAGSCVRRRAWPRRSAAHDGLSVLLWCAARQAACLVHTHTHAHTHTHTHAHTHTHTHTQDEPNHMRRTPARAHQHAQARTCMTLGSNARIGARCISSKSSADRAGTACCRGPTELGCSCCCVVCVCGGCCVRQAVCFMLSGRAHASANRGARGRRCCVSSKAAAAAGGGRGRGVPQPQRTCR